MSESNNKINSWGQTALHSAAMENNLSETVRLLSLGADVNTIDCFGQTPLHFAAISNMSDGHFAVMEALLNDGADVNVQDKQKKTPLHILVRHTGVRTLNLLLKHNADVSIKNSLNQIALFDAVRECNLDIVQLLVNHSCQVDPELLEYACVRRDPRVVECLLAAGVKIDFMKLIQILLAHSDFSVTKKILRTLLEYTDVNKKKATSQKILGYKDKKIRNVFLEHVALLEALEVSVTLKIMDTIIDDDDASVYLAGCIRELGEAKDTKLQNTWLTYFDVLSGRGKKLKNYAGNQDLVDGIKSSGCEEKFPIYGSQIMEKMEMGIERRKLFDSSCVVLSNCLPKFNPAHLVVRDVLDCLGSGDYGLLLSDA